MQINIPADAEALVTGKAAAAGFPNVDDYVLSLILRAADEDELYDEQLTPEELAESLAMCDRGMEDVKAGRSMSVAEARRQTLEDLGLAES
jgi:hypothetical protein